MNRKHHLLQVLFLSFLPVFCMVFAFGCSASDQNSGESDGSDPAMLALAENGGVDIGMLVIGTGGADLHDSSSVGPILKHLESGDSCHVIEQGHWEVIDGKSAHWYRVKFEESDGWVWGLETDMRGKAFRPRTQLSLGIAMELDSPAIARSFSGATPEIAWQAFKNSRDLNCLRRFRRAIAEGYDRENIPACYVSELEGLDFEWLDVLKVGGFKERFVFAQETLSNLWLAPVYWENHSNMTEGKNTLIGMHGTQWSILGVLDGYPKASMSLGQDTTILCFHFKANASDWGEERIDIWMNVESRKTLRKLQTIKLPAWYIDPEEESSLDSLSWLNLINEENKLLLLMGRSFGWADSLAWDSRRMMFTHGQH
jgi:hypothetical protein